MADTKEYEYSTKNSMFRDLFSEPGCLPNVYKALHPEDAPITEEDCTLVPLEDPFSVGINEDLVFFAKDKLIILMEPQPVWSANVLVRAFIYLQNAYETYLYDTDTFMCDTDPLKIPFPEIYVMYPGEKGNLPDELSLKDSFFKGENCKLNVTAQILYADKSDTVINQYITFFMTVTEQAKEHGKTKEAVSNAIRICREKGVLGEYLGRKEQQAEEMVLYALCLEKGDQSKK